MSKNNNNKTDPKSQNYKIDFDCIFLYSLNCVNVKIQGIFFFCQLKTFPENT